MSRRSATAFLACLAILSGSATLLAKEPALRVTGPVTCENLSLYLIHGENHSPARGYSTLQEGIEQKKVTVYETHGNQLMIENRSDRDLFVQSGEVVKGGDQDRTIEDDLVITPESGLVAIRCHCVEQGRSGPRGTESEHHFNASVNALASKEMKLANYADDQQGVWSGVSAMQSELASNIDGFGGTPDVSPSSFELTVESPQVNDAVQRYAKQLRSAPEAGDDVIGYAFAINGKLNSADLYASHDLLMKLWPKLLTAASVEAVANRPSTMADLKMTVPTPDAVAAALADMEGGVETHSIVIDHTMELTAEQKAQLQAQTPDGAAAPAKPQDRLSFVKRETDHAVEYTTCDSKADAPFVHRVYLTK